MSPVIERTCATVPRCGPLAKLLWADLLFFHMQDVLMKRPPLLIDWNIKLIAVVPRHYYVTFLNCNTHSGVVLAVVLLLKNSLID